jgi:hypothetical protein
MAEHRLEPLLDPQDAVAWVVYRRGRRGPRQREPCKRRQKDQADSPGRVWNSQNGALSDLLG